MTRVRALRSCRIAPDTNNQPGGDDIRGRSFLSALGKKRAGGRGGRKGGRWFMRGGEHSARGDPRAVGGEIGGGGGHIGGHARGGLPPGGLNRRDFCEEIKGGPGGGGGGGGGGGEHHRRRRGQQTAPGGPRGGDLVAPGGGGGGGGGGGLRVCFGGRGAGVGVFLWGARGGGGVCGLSAGVRCPARLTASPRGRRSHRPATWPPCVAARRGLRLRGVRAGAGSGTRRPGVRSGCAG